MDKNEKQLKRISVRNLVEFMLRHGDIDNSKMDGFSQEAMAKGGKIHRKIQRSMGMNYAAEVSLKTTIPFHGFEVSVEGRADGIITEEERVVIDEIKGTYRQVSGITEPNILHLAQAKCYAYIYAMQMELETIHITITYCNLDTEEIRRLESVHTRTSLEQWFEELMGGYEKWVRFEMEWKQTRKQSISPISFPFSYREGQKELVTSVYKTILRKKNLFIQAPTGIGKTMATVFPTVKAMGEGLGDKIFYLTAKTITRTVAQDAFWLLKEQGLRLKVVTLTAKDKLCFQEVRDCNPIFCPYAKGHYDRVNESIFELLQREDFLTREVIEEQAKAHKVCPFELMLDLSLWADVVICNYNYLFDPNAQLKRFFTEGIKGEYLFLIDEAHNLVERGREMYSASLYKEQFLALKNKVKYYDLRLAKALEGCNKIFLEYKRECETYLVLESVGNLYLRLVNLMTEMDRVLEECEDHTTREQILELYFGVRMFLYIYDRLDENYVIFSELNQMNQFQMKLFCVNPAVNIQKCLDRGNSTIFFSATLLPINYYKQLLSTDQENYAIYAHSPFKEEQRVLAIANDVTTKYTMRSETMYRKYGDYIQEMVELKKGKYLVFFPSYTFMESVYQAFLKTDFFQKADNECVLQEGTMSETEKEGFLEAFHKDQKGSLVGFAVLGGVFSEGIDLTQDKLIGVMVVGTGLPQVCYEREILKNYFDRQAGKGFDYAYVFPGMNKVMQAAGRVIRTIQDQGIILLLDERFRNRGYLEIMPREWESKIIGNKEEIKDNVEKFWE